ncbi:neuron navigator 2-like isoform X4 [Lampetra fluviatilis]
MYSRLPAPTPRAGGGVGGGVRTEGGLAKLSRRSQSFHSYDMDRRSPLARQSPGSIGRQLKSSSSQPSGMSGRLQPPAEGGSRLSAIPQPGGSGLRAPRSRPLTPELGVRASSSSSSSSSSLDVHLGGLGRHPATIMEEDVSGAPSPPPPPLPPPFGGAAREPRGLACGGAQRARKFHGGGGGGDGGDSRLARAVENAKAAGRLEVANFDGDGDVDFSPDGGFAALGFGALAATRLPSGGAQRLPRGGAREGPAPRCGADAATAAAGRRISCQERPSLDGGDTSERSERNDGAPRKTSRSLIARGDGGGAGGGGKRGSCSSGIPKPGACGQGGRRRGPTTGALGDCRVNGGSPLGLPLLKSPGDSKTSSSSSLASLEGRSTGSATPLSPGFLSPTPTGAGGGVTPHFPAGRISMPATPASGGQAVAAATAAAGGVAVATGAGRVLSNGVQLPLAQQQQQHPNTATVAPFSYRLQTERGARSGPARGGGERTRTPASVRKSREQQLVGESVETEWERNVKDINDLKQDLEETMSNLRDTQVPHSSLKAGFGPTGRPPWVDTASEHQGSPRMQAGEAPSLGTGRFPASSTSSLATAGSGGSGGGAAGPGRRPRSGVTVPADGGGRCYGRGPPRAAGRVGHEARPGACELFSEEDDEVMDEDEEDGEELVIECDDLEVSGYASDGDLLGKSLYRRQRTSGYLTDGGSGFSSHKLSLFQPGPQARSKVPRVTSLTPGEGDSWEDSSSVSSGLSDTIDNISTDDLNTSSSVSSYPTTPTNSRKNLSLQLKTDAEKCSLGEGGSGWYCSLPREGRKKADSRADTRSGTTGRAGGGYGGGGGAGEWGAVGRRSVEAGGGSSQAGGGDGEREKRARRRGLPVAGQYGMGSRATAATGGMTAAGGAAVTTAAAAAGGAVTPAGAASSRMSSRVTQLKTTGKTDDAKASEKRLMSPKPVRIQRAVSDAGRSVLGGDDTRKPPSGLARPIGMTATGIRKPGSGASGAMVTASGATIRSGSATVGKIPTARSGGLGGTLSRGGGGSAAGRKISLESTPVTEQMGLMNARASPQYRSLPRPAKSAYGKSRYTGEMSVGGGGAGGRAAGAAGGTTLKEAAKFTLGGSVTSLTNQTDREKAMLADTECAVSREAKLGGRAGFHPGSHQQELSYSGVSSPASRMSFGYKSKGKASAAESAAKASVGQQQQQPKTPALSMRRQLSGGGTVATSSEGRAPDSGNGSPMHAAATDTVSSLRDVPPPSSSSSSSSATAAAIAARDFDYSPLLLLPPASDFGAPESPPMSPASVKSADSCCHAPAASASPYPKGGPSYTSLGCSRNTSCESLGPPPAAAAFGGGHAEGRPASLRGSPVHYASPTSYGSPTHPAAHGTRDPKAAPLLHPAAATEMGIDGGGGGGVGGGSQGSPSKAVAGKSLLERYGMAYGRSSEEIAEQQRCHSVLGLCDSPDSLSLAPLPSLSSLASRYQLPVSPSLASPPPASPPPSPRLLGPQGSFEQLGREGPAKRLSAASLDGRPKALSRSTSFRDCTEQLHGSVLSLASCTSSIYSVPDEKSQSEIETLRRELDQSQDKVSTLTGQLSTNANLVAAFEKSLTSMTSRLQNLTASAEQKDSELGELRKMIDNLTKENMAAQEAMSGVLSTTQQSNTGSLSPQAGEPRLHRQNSCESISSVNSITSHSSAELADAKKKKKGWLKISFRQAFSKKKGGKGPGEGEPGKSPETSAQPAATSEADTTTPGQPGTKPSEGPAGPPPPEVDTIMQLRSELRHKEMKLTDIRLEALNSAHQLNTLQDAMNSMQSMIESLKVENDQLKSDTPVVGAATAPGGTAEPTSPRPLRSRLQHSRSLPSTSNLESLLKDSVDKAQCKQVRLVVSSAESWRQSKTSKVTQFALGRVDIGENTTWEELDGIIRHVFKEYIIRVDPVSSLGLSSESIVGYNVGAVRRTRNSPEPVPLPWDSLPEDGEPCIAISLKGLGESSLDSLAFEGLTPKPVLQRCSGLLLDHRHLVLCGPPGSGKSCLAAQLGQWLVRRAGLRVTDDTVATFSVNQSTADEIRQYLVDLAELCSGGLEIGDVPRVIILDGLQEAGQPGDLLTPAINCQHHVFPYLIGIFEQVTSATPDVKLHPNVRFVLHGSQVEPVKGFLGRFLRRRLVEAEVDTATRNSNLVKVIEWIPKLWRHLNRFLESHGPGGVSVGPHLFLSCPMDVSESRVWFVDLWNRSLLPFLCEAVRTGLQMYGKRGAWEDPTQWVLDMYPWAAGPGRHEAPLLARLRPEDAGYDVPQCDNHASLPKPTPPSGPTADPLMNMLLKLKEAADSSQS